MSSIVDEKKAEEIARNFLQQHHSVIKVEQPVSKDDIWLVKATVSLPSPREFEIKINSKTGRVLGF